jgi:hypothetical protein
MLDRCHSGGLSISASTAGLCSRSEKPDKRVSVNQFLQLGYNNVRAAWLMIRIEAFVPIVKYETAGSGLGLPTVVRITVRAGTSTSS